MLLLPTESDSLKGAKSSSCQPCFSDWKARRWDVMERRWSNDETICPVAHGYLECLGESNNTTRWMETFSGVIKLPIWGGKSLWQFLRDFRDFPSNTAFFENWSSYGPGFDREDCRGVFPPWSYQKMLLTRWEGSCGSFWFFSVYNISIDIHIWILNFSSKFLEMTRFVEVFLCCF